MTESSPAELQALIAAEFDRRRWEYDPGLGQALGAEIERTGMIDPARLARQVPAEFLHRAGIDRNAVEAAISAAIGGRTLGASQTSTVLNVDNRRYEVKLGRGAQIKNTNLNLGDGQQINVDVSVPKTELLAAVEAMVLAGVGSEWNSDAAAGLADVISARDDVTLDDIRELTVRTIQAQAPTHGRVKAFLDELAANTLGGVFGAGLIAGIGQVLPLIT